MLNCNSAASDDVILHCSSPTSLGLDSISQKSKNDSSLTYRFLSVSDRVVRGLTEADLLVFFHQHPLQAGPEQRRHTDRLLPPGAVDDYGVETTKPITFQQ